jgi:hypothetical protein
MYGMHVPQILMCRKEGEEEAELVVHFGHPVMDIKMDVHHTDIPSSV